MGSLWIKVVFYRSFVFCRNVFVIVYTVGVVYEKCGFIISIVVEVVGLFINDFCGWRVLWGIIMFVSLNMKMCVVFLELY